MGLDMAVAAQSFEFSAMFQFIDGLSPALPSFFCST
jgi:hypothetical protein